MSLEVKRNLLDTAARRIVANRQNPLIFGGALQQLPDGTQYNPKGIQLLRWPSGEFTRRQPSYLVGRISIRAGMYADRALTAYSKNDCINLAQLVGAAGWVIPDGKIPEIIREGDALTFVIPWPEHLQNNDAPLSELSGLESVWRNGRFVVGPDTRGDLFTPEFGIEKTSPGVIHHALIGGVTGSGKTWFMLSLAFQLAHHKDARIIILDGKGGDGVGRLHNIPGQVGPTVINSVDGVRNALAWVYGECMRRYVAMERSNTTACTAPPLYVFLSEFTAYTADGIGASDNAIIFMLATLAQKSRAANIHLILDTQYPRGSTFGDTAVRKQFDFTLCFRTADQYDTQALLPPGLNLRPYLTLSKPGDGYALIGGEVHRILTAYAPDKELRALNDSAEPSLREWPEFDASALEGFEASKAKGRPEEDFTAAQIRAAVMLWRNPPERGDKRTLLQKALRERTGSGISNSRAQELLDLGRELLAELDTADFCK